MAQKILDISCSPKCLAEDLIILKQEGDLMQEERIYSQQTNHMERGGDVRGNRTSKSKSKVKQR